MIRLLIIITFWALALVVQAQSSGPRVYVLGNVQDGGSPHIGCDKDCCLKLFETPDLEKMVVSLGIVEPINQSTWLIEATPDLTRQIHLLNQQSRFKNSSMPHGIFLTHAHIGHYTGLMYLGREAKGASEVPVYAMPLMSKFLHQNQPWKQLIDLKNIEIKSLQAQKAVSLSERLIITPILVPHRDELSETVGYTIAGPSKTLLFIPDINKWSVWNRSIVEEISKVDYALIDASFFNSAEIGYRDMSEIPHPFVEETMELLKNLARNEKDKVYFIHMNHTNPLLNPDSNASKKVVENGFHIARFLNEFEL